MADDSHGKAEDIGSFCDWAGGVGCTLWRDEEDSPTRRLMGPHVGGGGRDVEVGKLCKQPRLAKRNKDVVWLDVKVEISSGVHVCKASSGIRETADKLWLCQELVHPLKRVVHLLNNHEELLWCVLEDAIQLRDVRRRELQHDMHLVKHLGAIGYRKSLQDNRLAFIPPAEDCPLKPLVGFGSRVELRACIELNTPHQQPARCNDVDVDTDKKPPGADGLFCLGVDFLDNQGEFDVATKHTKCREGQREGNVCVGDAIDSEDGPTDAGWPTWKGLIRVEALESHVGCFDVVVEASLEGVEPKDVKDRDSRGVSRRSDGEDGATTSDNGHK